MTNEVRLYELRYDEAKTYVNVLLFVAGNILLPRMFHLFHMGGPTWQPIFFFTLVGAYKYGWRVGLLTALFSPLLNYAFFGMPSSVMLPVVMAKSVLLAARPPWWQGIEPVLHSSLLPLLCWCLKSWEPCWHACFLWKHLWLYAFSVQASRACCYRYSGDTPSYALSTNANLQVLSINYIRICSE